MGFLRARSSMILLARNSSRRCTTVTLAAWRVRKLASSIAVSPPPTMATCFSLKKAPSQVAQAETPWPIRRISLGRPSSLALAPVEMIRLFAWKLSNSLLSVKGRLDRSTSTICSNLTSVPKRCAWARKSSIIFGPMTPSG